MKKERKGKKRKGSIGVRIYSHSWGKWCWIELNFIKMNDQNQQLHTCYGRQANDLYIFVCWYFKGHGFWWGNEIGVYPLIYFVVWPYNCSTDVLLWLYMSMSSIFHVYRQLHWVMVTFLNRAFDANIRNKMCIVREYQGQYAHVVGQRGVVNSSFTKLKNLSWPDSMGARLWHQSIY